MDGQRQLQLAEWIRTGANVLMFIGVLGVLGSIAFVEKPANLIIGLALTTIALWGVDRIAARVVNRSSITPK